MLPVISRPAVLCTFLFSVLSLSNAVGNNRVQVPLPMTATTPNKASEPFFWLQNDPSYFTSRILGNIENSTKPCDNFYEFACGNYMNTRVNYDSSSKTTLFVYYRLKRILSEPPTDEEIKPVHDAKNYFSLCMNEKKIEEEGLERIRKLFEAVGGWPVLEHNWNSNGSWKWNHTMYKFRNVGFDVDYLIELNIKNIHVGSYNSVLQLKHPSFGISREHLLKGLNDAHVQEYYNFMVDVVSFFSVNHSRIREELLESLKFEIKLAELSIAFPKTYMMTFYNLTSIFATYHWAQYTSNILRNSYNLTSDDIVFAEIQYVINLENLLELTPKRVVANYLLWRATQDAMEYLPLVFRVHNPEYQMQEPRPRWMECVHSVLKRMHQAVSYVYIKRYMDPEAKRDAEVQFRRIKYDIGRGIVKMERMGIITRQAALDELQAMKSYVGYPDELLDDGEMVKLHEDLVIRPNDSFLEAYMALNRFWKGKWSSVFAEQSNKTPWYYLIEDPLKEDSYYMKKNNPIKIEYPTMYCGSTDCNRKKMSNYFRYDTVGMVVTFQGFGTKSIDTDKKRTSDKGRHPVSVGNIIKELRCLINQYRRHTSKQANRKAMDKNIVKNSSLKYAYRAYSTWVEEHGEDIRFPGLEQFTPRQMFWLVYANDYCSSHTDAYMLGLIRHHRTPDKFRVLGPLSNSPEFARDFGCPLGSNMNPVKKCDVW